jgi:hypothetical protein
MNRSFEMDTQTTQNQMLELFKAFADSNRLQIAGLLVGESLTMDELSKQTGLKLADVQRHLGQLVYLGLVKADQDHYRLDRKALESQARQVLSNMRPRTSEDAFDGEDFDRKVLSDFFQPDGRLRSIPSQQKKRLVILNYLAGNFEGGKRYPEKQVNETLKRFFEDYASLRRYLVDDGLLQRERNEYWKV